MTKSEMVDGIAKAADITKKAAAAALEAFVETITKDLKKGNNVVSWWCRKVDRKLAMIRNKVRLSFQKSPNGTTRDHTPSCFQCLS